MSDIPDPMADEICAKQTEAWRRIHSAEDRPAPAGPLEQAEQKLKILEDVNRKIGKQALELSEEINLRDKRIAALEKQIKALLDGNGRIGKQLIEFSETINSGNEHIAALEVENFALKARAEQAERELQGATKRYEGNEVVLRNLIGHEKQIRVKYQDAVYAVCDALDAWLGHRPSKGDGLLATKDSVLPALKTILNRLKT